MRVQLGQMVALGYGKYALSDEVISVQPIEEGRGPGRRTKVWLRGIAEPVIASRSEEAIIDDLTTPAEETARLRQQRSMLQQAVRAFESVPPVFRRVLREESGVDFDALAGDMRKVLG